MIPYGKQNITSDDIDSVVSVLKSDFLTQGQLVPLFEGTVSEYCGSDYGVACNSATSALHIACLSLGLGPGDKLWTSPNTFVASSNCALYCGASVDFVDVDPVTRNMSVDQLKQKLIAAKMEGALPKVVIPVHFAGESCDMAAIHELSQKFGFKVIEDASHAIGASYNDAKVGSCKYSDITVFSFHPVKIITTAEGGMAMTNDEALAEKMRLYRSHGVTRDEHLMQNEPHGAWYYEQVALGLNYRMTELQAALGVSQMKRLDEFIAKRHLLKKRYDQLLEGLPILLPKGAPNAESSWHLYPIEIESHKTPVTRKEAFDSLRMSGIGVNVHYIPVHLQPYYNGMGFRKGDFPAAEKYYSGAISLPLFFAMTYEEQDLIVEKLKELLGR